MKNNRKRILMSILTLVLTIVALGTTTFAWFSLSNIATVKGFEANVQAGDGLEVRLYSVEGGATPTYDSGFKSHLTAADWGGNDGFFGKVADEFAFAAVTTLDGVDFKELSQRDDGHLGFVDVANGANSKYIEFKFDFRSLQEGTVQLTELVFGDGNNPALLFNPVNDLRYMQFEGDDVAAGSNKEVIARASNALRVAFLWDNNNLKVYQKDGAAYANDPLDGNHANGKDAIEAGQWSYLESKQIELYSQLNGGSKYELDNGVIADAMIAAIEASDLKDAGKETIITLADIGGGYYGATVTVRIWVEGWDSDTYDAIFETTATVDFTFTKITP